MHVRHLLTTLSRMFAYAAAILLVFASSSLNHLHAQEGSDEQETVFPLDDDGKLVQFERDIAPILRDRCLECHGPDDAKNDFRVDDPDSMLEYIEADDHESSILYTDYLTIDDEDMLMPPTSHGGPLSAGDLAVFRVWICLLYTSDAADDSVYV